MQEYRFTKLGRTVVLAHPRLNSYDALVCRYKIIGDHENKLNDKGFYYNAVFESYGRTGILEVYKAKIADRIADGFKLPPEISTEFTALRTNLLAKRKSLRKKLVSGVVRGIRPITFSIVGCDYPYYQAWLPDTIEGQEQTLVEMAVREYFTGNGIKVCFGNACQFLERLLGQSISAIPHPKATNVGRDPKVQAYHGYKKEIITSFDVTLSVLLDNFITKETVKQQEVARIKEQEEKERAEFTVKITRRGYSRGEENDPYAEVFLTDPVSGETVALVCRNIFDFGFVVNRVGGGGLPHYDEKKGWFWDRWDKEDIHMTEMEVRAVKYLQKFSPISTNIRM
jgi:hypothetical protein